jgi:hypothetical protein
MKRIAVVTVLSVVVFFGSGCSRVPDNKNAPDLTNSQTQQDRKTRRCPLTYDQKQRRFFCSAPYGSSNFSEDEVLLAKDESLSPDKIHHVSVVFEESDPGVEGVALVLTNDLTNEESVYPLAANETLVSALEDEAGWPVMNMTYDQIKNEITYSVYRREGRIPYLDTSGNVYPKSRALIEDRRISLE